MICVLIESPFAGRHGSSCDCTLCHEDVVRNQKYARAAMRDCLLRGEAPFASHLLYTQEGILNDHLQDERMMGIQAGLVWGELARMTVVYVDLGISKGMQLGIEAARKANRVIVYRSLPAYTAGTYGA